MPLSKCSVMRSPWTVFMVRVRVCIRNTFRSTRNVCVHFYPYVWHISVILFVSATIRYTSIFSRMLTEFGTVSTWKNILKSFFLFFFRFHRRAFSSQSRNCSLAGHQSIVCPGSNVAKFMVLYMYGNILNSLYSNAMFQWTIIILILMYKNALSKSNNFYYNVQSDKKQKI